MIHVAGVTGALRPGYQTSNGIKTLQATSRIAMNMYAVLRAVHPNFGNTATKYDQAGESAVEYLEDMLRLDSALSIDIGNGVLLASQLYAGYMLGEGDDAVFLIGGFIGDDPIQLQQVCGDLFNLSVEDIAMTSDNHWLVFFVFRQPPYGPKPFTVAAVMATHQDGWGPDAYNLPVPLRTKILEAALPLLDTTS